MALVCTMSAPAAAQSRYLQCVAYARQVTGVAIRGNANTWWGQAANLYARGNAPKAGAILAFKSIPGMRAGHVAVVSEIVNDREVLLDHANWSYRGGVEHGARAIDVSEAGDWSKVRVWYGKTHELGTRVNPTFGFIYPEDTVAAPLEIAQAKPAIKFALSRDVVQLAMLEGAGGQ